MKILGITLNSELKVDEHIDTLIKSSLSSLYALRILKAYGLGKEAIHTVTEVIIMSRILYAAPAWWGLTQTSDILKIDKLQRKLQRIEYAPYDQPTVESKVHKAEEKLFKKVIVAEDHVLRQYLQQNNAIKYNLRPRPHNFLLPPKDDILFVSRIGSLSERSKHYTSK